MKTNTIREVTLRYKNPRKLGPQILGPDDAANAIRRLLPDNVREHFVALYLDGNHKLVSYSIVATGTANSCPVHPREVFQRAIMCGAVALVVGHNHPSSSLEPSKEDKAITARLKDGAELLALRLLDSVIVNDNNFVSIIN